jgi:acetyl-CoA carboxylase biotin carboxyl carrier protein
MQRITAMMAGIVAQVLVQPGETVEPGQEVVVLESMKMQIPVTTPVGGTVRTLHTSEGAFVNEGDLLLELAP